MKFKENNIETRAFILAKKDKSKSIRKILIVGEYIPFSYISAFGASHSSVISALTSPFVLVNIRLKEQKWGFNLIDGYMIQHYPQINENLEYFEIVYEWVNILIKTHGAGADERVFTLLEKLFAGIENSVAPVVLNGIFYANFLHIMGVLPECQIYSHLEILENNLPLSCLSSTPEDYQIYLSLKKTLQTYLGTKKDK
ncbi:MAG: hypothetical protein ACRCVN_06410 [Spirochaetia bacterium]